MMSELPEPVMPGQMELDFGYSHGVETESYEECVPCGGRCTMWDDEEDDCD